MDQAGWHVSKNLEVPENVRLIPLPPHSPASSSAPGRELNPVEQVWDDVREKGFHNQAFQSLDDVEDRLCEQLIALENQPQRLRSLTSFPYLNITC
jgi:hypothetical protein